MPADPSEYPFIKEDVC